MAKNNVVELPAPTPLPAHRKDRLKLTDANVRTLPSQGQDPKFGPAESCSRDAYESLRGKTNQLVREGPRLTDRINPTSGKVGREKNGATLRA
jgi:hypothetical protein